MDFLVRIEVGRVLALPEPDRLVLIGREWRRAAVLHAEGVLRQLWSLPDEIANVGIWSAADGASLRVTLETLPVWPYVEVLVNRLGPQMLFPDAYGDLALRFAGTSR